MFDLNRCFISVDKGRTNKFLTHLNSKKILF